MIKLGNVCDGNINCRDKSDESDCESYECLPGTFKCPESFFCIPQTLVCNTYFDCDAQRSEDENSDLCKDWNCSEGLIKLSG